MKGALAAAGVWALQSAVNRTSVIVSLLVAVGLTVISIFTLGSAGGAAPERQSVLELDPAAVTALSVVRSARPGDEGQAPTEVRVERGRLPGQWLVRTGDGGEASAWPIAAERMRAALRVLSELRGVPVAEPLPAGAATLTVEREGAGPLTLRIAPPGLGGRRLVEVAGEGGGVGAAGVYEIEDWLHEAMVTSGPAQWRDKAALPGVGVEASRVALVTGSVRITLSRAGGRWGMTAPVGARANPEAVEALLGLLSRMQVSRFYDNPAADDITGLDAPLAQVRVDREITIPDGDQMRRITESVTLEIGGPIDAMMATLFARVTIASSLEGAPRGQAVVAVSAADLNRINAIPSAYIAPRAVRAPASEIGGLALARPGSASVLALERTGVAGRSGWELRQHGAEDVTALSDARSNAVGEALSLFCETPAGAILLEQPEGYEQEMSVELQSLGGSPLEIIDLGAMPAPSGPRAERLLVIRTGEVYRIYESRAVAALNVLLEMLDEVAPPLAGESQREPGDDEPDGN